MLPFAVYLAADALGASGVIAVVVAALQMRQSSDADDSRAPPDRRRVLGRRRDARDRGRVRADRAGAARRWSTGAGDGLGRMLAHAGSCARSSWSCGRCGWREPGRVRRRLPRPPDPAPRSARPRRAPAARPWCSPGAGMRGLATLALALALPLTTDDGAPFPGRAELIVIAAR